MYFTGGETNYVLRFATANPNELYPTNEDDAVVGALVYSYGLGTQLPESPRDAMVYDIDGISYTVRESGEAITLTPSPSAWE